MRPTLAHDVTGDGPDLVLIHAGVADRRMWDPLVALLRDRYRITTLDLRGFGETASDATPFSNAGDVADLLDALGIRTATVAGASYGGRVALELAATRPERVSRLVLLAAGLPDQDWSPRVLEFFEAEEAAFDDGRLDEAVELNVDLWAGDASDEVKALVRAMQRRSFDLQAAVDPVVVDLDPPVTDRLDAVAMPVDVVYGDADLEEFETVARRLAAELPDATLHVIPGAGHLIALEEPGAVARLIGQ